MRDLYYIIAYTYLICIGILLFVGTLFFPGSFAEMKVSVTNPHLGYFASHILLNLAVIAVFLLFFFIVSFAFGKWIPFKERLRFHFKAFLLTGGVSIVMILINYLIH